MCGGRGRRKMVYFIYKEVLVIRNGFLYMFMIVTRYASVCSVRNSCRCSWSLITLKAIRIYFINASVMAKGLSWRISKFFFESDVCRCKAGFHCGMNIMTVYLKLWYVITVVKIGDKLQPCTAGCCLVYG